MSSDNNLSDIYPTDPIGILRLLIKHLETEEEWRDFIVLINNGDGTHTEISNVNLDPYRMIGAIDKVKFEINKHISELNA